MAAAEAEREEEQNWAAQEDAVLRMRGMLEDEQHARSVAYHRQIVEENKRMARDKAQREENWRNDQESQNQAEVTLTNHNEVLEATGTVRRTDNWR